MTTILVHIFDDENSFFSIWWLYLLFQIILDRIEQYTVDKIKAPEDTTATEKPKRIWKWGRLFFYCV